MDIQDRVAVVTGAAAGTGRAIGERLAARGAAVALTDVDAEQGAETLRRIRAAGGRAEFLPADLTDDSAARRGGGQHRLHRRARRRPVPVARVRRPRPG